MNIFDHFRWLVFCKNLVGCIGVGTLLSVSIALNLRVQKRFLGKAGFRSNFIQAITYFCSIGVFGSTTIYFFGNIVDGEDASSLEIVVYVAGIVIPIILAGLSGFIPANPKKSKHEGPQF